MELDADFLEQLLATFRTELEEQADLIARQLLDLERLPDPARREELLHTAFRAAHNVKGAARGVEILPIVSLAHEMESYFSTLRKQGALPSPDRVGLCLKALDCMRDVARKWRFNGENSFDIKELIDLFHAAPAPEPTPEPAPEPAPAPPAAPTPEIPATPAGPASRQTVTPPQDLPATLPVPETPAGPEDTVRVAVARLDRMAALAEDLQSVKIQIDTLYDMIRRMAQRAESLGRLPARMPEPPANAPAAFLDHWQHWSQELTSECNALSQLTYRARREARGRVKELAFLTNLISENIHMMRLIPARGMLAGMERMVRELARELGKTVTLDIQGADIRMDRQILEKIRDPLNHLLRNALDHGIEPAAARRQAGKPEAGRLELHVRSDGNQILITLADDGAGMSPALLREVALRRGAITPEELSSLGDDQVLDLIFRPGFSSRDQVTTLSGRGVGLDVVRTNLKSLRGDVSVATVWGVGTTFTLTLPLTLAAEHGLLVRVGEHLLAFPITAVERLEEFRPDGVVLVGGTPALMLNDRPVPLRPLGDLFGGPARCALAGPTGRAVVFVTRGTHTVGFLVDEVIGDQELVVKPFLPPIRHLRHLKGGALGGSGEVILVLNTLELIDTCVESTAPHCLVPGTSAEEDAPPAPRHEPRHVLVVDDSITTRTLEKNILETNGYRVSIAVNGMEAWERMQAERFDLVVTDIEMPKMDGFTLTGRIKGDTDLRTLPVIIVSSLDRNEHRERGLEVGADAYIVKSQFETRKLVETVRRLLP
ncbi:MAG: response regulator [Magnetococcus sp. WYHC-3]